MRKIREKVLCMTLIIAMCLVIFLPKKTMADTNVPIDYRKSTTTVKTIPKTYVINDHVNSNRAAFATALTSDIAAANTQAGKSYVYDVRDADSLVPLTDDNGFLQYPVLSNFSPSSDGVTPGIANYRVQCVTYNELIDEININVSLPEVGTIIEEATKPTVTLDEDANYTVTNVKIVNNYPSADSNYDDGSIYGNKINNGEDYYVELVVTPKEGYDFTFKSKVDCTINGEKEFERGQCIKSSHTLFVKVRAEGEEPNNEEPVPEAETQKNVQPKNYTFLKGEGIRFNLLKDSGLEFEIDADYDLFENGGIVYVDDEKVDPKNYKSKSGSTIITFEDDYVRALESGEHTLKVAFNDEGTAKTTFVIYESNAPKAADNIIIYLCMAFVAILCVTVIDINKKR